MASKRKTLYSPDKSGLKSLGRSSNLSKAVLGFARDLAGTAESAGHSTYDAAPYTVTVGRDNESRTGAIAYEAERDFRDARDEMLKRTAAAMGTRNTGA